MPNDGETKSGRKQPPVIEVGSQSASCPLLLSIAASSNAPLVAKKFTRSGSDANAPRVDPVPRSVPADIVPYLHRRQQKACGSGTGGASRREQFRHRVVVQHDEHTALPCSRSRHQPSRNDAPMPSMASGKQTTMSGLLREDAEQARTALCTDRLNAFGDSASRARSLRETRCGGPSP